MREFCTYYPISISKSGMSLVYFDKQNKTYSVYNYSDRTKKNIIGTFLGWSRDGGSIISIDPEKGVFVYNENGSSGKNIAANRGVPISFIDSSSVVNRGFSDFVEYLSTDAKNKRDGVSWYQFSINKANKEYVISDAHGVLGIASSNDGSMISRIVLEMNSGVKILQIKYLRKKSSKWHNIEFFGKDESVSGMRFFDGTLYFLSNKWSDMQKVYGFNTKTGAIKSIRSNIREDIISYLVGDRNGRTLIVDSASYRILGKNKNISELIGISGSGRELISVVNSSGKTYLLKDGDNLKEVPSECAKYTGKISYINGTVENGGFHVPYYLSIPEGNGKAVPMVVDIHGGPFDREYFMGDNGASYWADKGFALLKINYRGSSGLGKKFAQAGYGNIDDLMVGDIEESIKAASSFGTIDKNKIILFGHSFGGYESIRVALRHRIKINGIILINSPHDINRMVSSWSPWKNIIYNKWGFYTDNGKYGTIKTDDIRSINAPILLIYGDKDDIVPSIQSVEIKKALVGVNSMSNFIEIKNGDHVLSSLPQRDLIYDYMVGWIKNVISP
ncbi:prolyl oligopeptidase family protein [Nitrospirillum bahiense]|uniref:Prolyl oligopeptidase family protein n=2 Tax=Nitrospirillum amazonense TaxID=28077 RepID=A0A560FVF3_9PROT|nr:prolyl oligopeptidase family protein [Nitrospirillum amazonense]